MKNWFSIALILIILGCSNNPKGVTVVFPEVSEPEQITQNGKEHFFASYYGINSFSKSQRFVTVLETDVKDRIPTELDRATLGLVDLQTKEFIPLATTGAWNFQ